GALEETGGPDARGRTVNVPWPPGMGDGEYLEAFDRVLLPLARKFEPDLVLVSAGFDAAAGDLLGSMRITPAGYSQMTARRLRLARGRLVLALEGGYDYDAISRSCCACTRVLLGEDTEPVRSAPLHPIAERILNRVVDLHRSFESAGESQSDSGPDSA